MLDRKLIIYIANRMNFMECAVRFGIRAVEIKTLMTNEIERMTNIN